MVHIFKVAVNGEILDKSGQLHLRGIEPPLCKFQIIIIMVILMQYLLFSQSLCATLHLVDHIFTKRPACCEVAVAYLNIIHAIGRMFE